MHSFTSATALQLRYTIFGWLRTVYLAWRDTHAALEANPFQETVKETKKGRHYVYRGGDFVGAATEEVLAKWKKHRQLMEEKAAQEKELKEIKCFYRAAQLPLIHAETGKILRQLERSGMLGSSIFVIGVLGTHVHDIVKDGTGSHAQLARAHLVLLIVSNESDLVAWANPAKTHEARIAEIMAEYRDAYRVQNLAKRVMESLKGFAIDNVSMYLVEKNEQLLTAVGSNKCVPIPNNDMQTLRAWGARQWADSHSFETVILLGTDGRPAPVVVPDQHVTAVLSRAVADLAAQGKPVMG